MSLLGGVAALVCSTTSATCPPRTATAIASHPRTKQLSCKITPTEVSTVCGDWTRSLTGLLAFASRGVSCPRGGPLDPTMLDDWPDGALFIT